MDWIEEKIDEIRNDRSHGAAQLAASAVHILASVCKHSKAEDPEQLESEVRHTALSLAEARPSMAPIRNWSLVFARRFKEKIKEGPPHHEARKQGMVLGDELLQKQKEFVNLQIEAAQTVLRRCSSVVTLSYSSTVESILRHSRPSHYNVIIAESRPLMEGRRLFTNLMDSSASVRMITDAQLGLAVPHADLVLVGADTILRDLAVVNKTGTYLSALVAAAHGCDFFVAADTFKINVKMDAHNCILESKSGREIWPEQEKHCENVYFDITPGKLVTGFVTEEGILDVPGMSRVIRRWEEITENFEQCSR
jgi:translation initiation factor 2B subunit (eIF-2B alpha/beta/delta family)